MRIEQATPEMADFVGRMGALTMGETWPNHSSDAITHDCIGNAHTFLTDDSVWSFVAYKGDTPIGAITVCEVNAVHSRGPYGQIQDVGVEPAHRSDGVMSALVDEVKRFGTTRDWRTIELTGPPTTAPEEDRALEFFNRNGFQTIGPTMQHQIQIDAATEYGTCPMARTTPQTVVEPERIPLMGLTPVDIQLYLIEPEKLQLGIEAPIRYRSWFNPHSYRCTPLAIANTMGWDLTLPIDVRVSWDGGFDPDNVKILEGGELVGSNFGIGTFTFDGMCGQSWLTPPGWSMQWGPIPNGDDIGVQAMTAIAETEWLKYPVFPTIKITHPGEFFLPKGTRIIRIQPVQIEPVAEGTITVRNEPDDRIPVRAEWTEDRDRQLREPEAVRRQWIKRYFNGVRYRQVDANPAINAFIPDTVSVEPETVPVDTETHDKEYFSQTLATLGIHTVDSYLTEDECKRLLTLWDGGCSNDANTNEMWKGRCCWADWPVDIERKLRDELLPIAEEFYSAPLEQDNLHMVVWRPGDSMPPHSDYGGQNEFPHRKVSAIIYLNDTFTGGETEFPDLEAHIRCDPGTMVMFRGGDLFHGVKEVLTGERFTVICWFGPSDV